MDQIVRPFDTVTIFGGATLDRVAQSGDAPVMGASNPGTVRRIPGGVGFNVATVVARLGLDVRLVTAVGDDSDGDSIVTVAKGVGIDVTHVIPSPGASTAGYHATFDNSGNLIIGIADMKICEAITPAAVASAVSSSNERDFWVVDANLPVETLAFLAEEAKNARHPIAALTVSPAKAVRLVPLLDTLSYLFTNCREAAALLGRNPDAPNVAVTALAGELAGHRAAKVVVTNGTEPLAAASGGDVRSYAPLRAAVKGVNGAGDSFAAGVILGLAEGHPLRDAIRFGLAASVMTLEAGSIIAAQFSKDALAERIGAGPAGADRRIAS
jgi:pseudouridine kinase